MGEVSVGVTSREGLILYNHPILLFYNLMPTPGIKDIRIATIIKIRTINARITWIFNSELVFSGFFDFFSSRGKIVNLAPHPEQNRAPSGFFVPHF